MRHEEALVWNNRPECAILPQERIQLVMKLELS
jgi:hypothetical protein